MSAKKMVLLIASLCMAFVPAVVFADTIINGDLLLRDGGRLIFPDHTDQSTAQVQGPKGEKGDKGDTGLANTLTIGNVTTGNPGTAAGATITGTAPNQTLNLLIPQGPQGPTDQSGGLIQWLTVYTSLTVTPNTGYIVDNDNNQVTLTLPQNAAIGDMVRVVGAGMAGWKVVPSVGGGFYKTNITSYTGIHGANAIFMCVSNNPITSFMVINLYWPF